MAQPPGSETFASPMRASNGAMTQKLARMRDTRSKAVITYKKYIKPWNGEKYSEGRS